MALKDKIRETILNFLEINTDNIVNVAQNKQFNLSEYKIWYLGNSEKLMRYYTLELPKQNKDLFSIKNKVNYFWALSTSECNIKRVHSGLPKVIIDTLSDVVGMPKIRVNDKYTKVLQEIFYENDFNFILTKQQRPLTMVEGWGAYKININREISDLPIIEYYEADKVQFVFKESRLQAVIFKDTYEYQHKTYELLEIRKVENGTSIIEYELYRNGKQENLEEVPFLAHLKDQRIEFKGLKRPLAIPTRYLVDCEEDNYGYSFFEGKIDLFDDLDQCLSQASQTTRVSTPVEYFSPDILGQTRNGRPTMPKVYNRQFIQRDSIPDGDGKIDNDVITTQPQLNFSQYNDEAMFLLSTILTGHLSPATLGVDLAKKDNAEAQREKEKVTIVTRNKIIDREKRFIRELVEDLMFVYDFMHSVNGSVTIRNYDVAIDYEEFATPTFENKLDTLGRAFANESISIERYVDLLWGDRMTEEEKVEEVVRLKNLKNADNLNLESFETE